MLRRCLKCGALYDGAPYSTLCPACAAASRASSVIRQRVCRNCGKTFDGGPRAWYCPECRAERAKKANNEYHQRARMGNTRKIGSIDICKACGKPYVVNGGNQMYCPACGEEVVREKDRASSKTWAKENIDINVKRENRQRASAEIPCVVCGKMFVPDSPAKTCSPECSQELARRNAAEREKKNAESRNKYHRERGKNKMDTMTPEELAKYREKINARARENYKKRRNSPDGK